MKTTKELQIEMEQEALRDGERFQDLFMEYYSRRDRETRELEKRAFVENELGIEKLNKSIDEFQEFIDGVNDRFVKDF